MKGWEFTGTHQPLKIVEKPDPQVKPGYVVLKTLAGGLCHSDVSALDIESWMGSFNVPVIMGHEVCGEIVEIGEGVEGYEIGDVVEFEIDPKDVNRIAAQGAKQVFVQKNREAERINSYN